MRYKDATVEEIVNHFITNIKQIRYYAVKYYFDHSDTDTAKKVLTANEIFLSKKRLKDLSLLIVPEKHEETLLDQLRSHFKYSEDSPSGLVRIKNCFLNGKRGKKDSVAGFKQKYRNYWHVSFKCKKYAVHRLIYMLENSIQDYNYFDDKVIDHIDGNGLNNKIENLRVVTQKTNVRNSKRNPTETGVVGVSKVFNGKHYYYISTYYHPVEGKKVKYFSIRKLGEDKALQLATEYRHEGLRKMQEVGSGYSGRHLESSKFYQEN